MKIDAAWFLERASGAPLDRPIPRRLFLQGCLAGLLAPSLPGCGGDGIPAGPQEEEGLPFRLTARPGDPTTEPPSGLVSLGIGDSRDGLLYVPEGYDPALPPPLFVALHGAGGSAENWQSYPPRAEDRNMVFLAIDSRGVTWDVIRGAYGPDVRFLNRALEHTFERCRIDPERIALGGFSDGATYALSLGLVNGDLFTHLVGYSPGFVVRPDPPAGEPTIFVSHGTDDPVLSVETTRSEIVPGLRDGGYDVTFLEFDGGHGVPSEISEQALDWFLEEAV
ncbi:MAG: hypothetical protein GWM92_16420 [Gemmatimonadetes bacterium]|nr:hypothetical protein [Gemmatimonadota bacterium]NIR80341.1 hypothetical protein [Gemmatimonadota bacterium]NIT89104.1 hypothetical protein [Gemmatimonadota bacterium]NIU32901.1 hypothetical protein [Gemmatimonadota bacterium]NIU37300.1 hypothetical protein [Gemmatimonadota bacterium]